MNWGGCLIRYKLFLTPMCPNCHKLKVFLKSIDLEGEFIDAATKEGLEEARKYNVGGVPVVLFFNEKNEVISEAHSIEEVKRIIENRSLSDV